MIRNATCCRARITVHRDVVPILSPVYHDGRVWHHFAIARIDYSCADQPKFLSAWSGEAKVNNPSAAAISSFHIERFLPPTRKSYGVAKRLRSK